MANATIAPVKTDRYLQVIDQFDNIHYVSAKSWSKKNESERNRFEVIQSFELPVKGAGLLHGAEAFILEFIRNNFQEEAA
jgi:hypothetical protein